VETACENCGKYQNSQIVHCITPDTPGSVETILTATESVFQIVEHREDIVVSTSFAIFQDSFNVCLGLSLLSPLSVNDRYDYWSGVHVAWQACLIGNLYAIFPEFRVSFDSAYRIKETLTTLRTMPAPSNLLR
jgi:hypothetical protein